MKKLKNWPLSMQIWLVFSSVIAIIFILLSMYFSFTIRKFFTDEMYNTIEIAQENTIQKALGETGVREEVITGTANNDIRDVKHIKLSFSNDEANLTKIEKIIPNKTNAELFLKKLKTQAESQTESTKKYAQKTNTGRVLYVIRVNNDKKKSNYIVSYMWDTYKNSLSRNLLRKLFTTMIIALIISLIAAKYLAQKLVVPLRQLESNVKNIGIKQWHESIDLDRNDEIGALSKSIENMRKDLVKQDEYEQTMLQQVSHDLKTPLMVIRSYVKAVEDGIYPKGNLENTMKVIDSEAESMQKRIKNLLYLTKIRYMTKYKSDFKIININPIVKTVVNSFLYNEKNINFELNISDIKVLGDAEQWAVVFENIIDNQLRYANHIIRINIYEDDICQYIIIYNDGEHIPSEKLEAIFDTFNKDKGGNFGLGLDIVRRIVAMYNGSIKAENNDIGVSFIITLKKVIII